MAELRRHRVDHAGKGKEIASVRFAGPSQTDCKGRSSGKEKGLRIWIGHRKIETVKAFIWYSWSM